MSAAAAPTLTLMLLAPSAALPEEGAEEIQSLSSPDAGLLPLLGAYARLVSARAPLLRLKDGGLEWEGDIEEHSWLQLVDVSADDGSPALDLKSASTRIDWSRVASEAATAMADPHFISSPDSLQHVLGAALQSAASDAASGFLGEAVPLLQPADGASGDEGAVFRFLGILLADESIASELCRSGESGCVVLNREAEGRGLKELALSALMLAVVLPGISQGAEPRSVSTASAPRKTSWLASLFSGDTARGEVLRVTSQRLVQAPPRIYRETLDSAGGTRVVVDIGAQRAYLLRGGQIAFETPISSGQGRTWTPRGSFTITEKVRSGKISTIYKCPLPGWMRIGNTKVGMHEGQLPGYPASHGCVRMPIESAHFIFDHAPVGTPVQIVDSWSPEPAVPAATLAQG